MNIGTLTVSMALRTVGAVQSLNQFESGVLQSVSRMNAKMAGLGRTFTYAVSAPILIGGAAAIKMFTEFEYTMAKITGLAGVQATQVQAWSGELLKLSSVVGKSAQELAEGLYFVASSGIKGAKAMEVLKFSALGAMAGMGKTMDVANLLTSVINAYGANNVNAARTMDVLTAAIREGKAEAADMAKALGYVVNVAAEMDISFANVAAAVAATTRTGASASTSVTQLRQLLFSFIKERPQVEKALTMVGLEYQQVRDWMKEDLLTGLIKLDAVMEEWGVETIGKIFPNVRALNEFLALTGKNVVENMKVFNAVKNSYGDFKTAIDAVANTAKVRLDSALQLINASLITFGSTLAERSIPLIQKLAGAITDLVTWFTSLAPQTQDFILKMGLLGAVIGPVLIAVSSLTSALLGLLSVLATPMTPIIAAIAVFTAAASIVGNNWETILVVIANTYEKLKIATLQLINWLIDKWKIFVDWFSSNKGFGKLGGLVRRWNEWLINDLYNISDKGALDTIVENNNKAIEEIQKNLVDVDWGDVWDLLEADAKKGVDKIKKVFANLQDILFGAIGGGAGGLNIGGGSASIDALWKQINSSNSKAQTAMEKTTLLKMYGQGVIKPFFGMESSIFASFGFTEEEIKEINEANKVMQIIADLKAKARQDALEYSKYLAMADNFHEVADMIADTLEPLRKQKEMLEQQDKFLNNVTWSDRLAAANQEASSLLELQSKLKEFGWSMPEDLVKRLQSVGVTIDDITSKISKLEFVESAFKGLADVISTTLTESGNGFKNFVKNMGQYLKQMVAQLIAAAIASFILISLMANIPGFNKFMSGSSMFSGVGQNASYSKMFGAAFGALGGFRMADISQPTVNNTLSPNLTSKTNIAPLSQTRLLASNANNKKKLEFEIAGRVIKAITEDATLINNIY